MLLFFTHSILQFLCLYFAYLFRKRSACNGRFYIFFICVLMSKEWPVRVLIGNQVSLRGRKVKITVFRTLHIVWIWFWMDRWQVKSNSVSENLILHSLNWTDRSTIHPKLKSKLGVEFRKTLGSTARPRGQMLLAWCF